MGTTGDDLPDDAGGDGTGTGVPVAPHHSSGVRGAEESDLYGRARRALSLLGNDEIMGWAVVVGALDGNRDLVTDLISDLDAEAADVQSVLNILETAGFPEIDKTTRPEMVRGERAFQTAVAWQAVERLRLSAPRYRDLERDRALEYQRTSQRGKAYERLSQEIRTTADEMESDVAQAQLLARNLRTQRRAAREALTSILSAGVDPLESSVRQRVDFR